MHKCYLTHTFKQSWLSVVALAICLVFAQGCAEYHLAMKDSDPAEKPYKGKMIHSLGWGLLYQPQQITTDCNTETGINDVVVKSNYLYSLAAVLTLGMWMPMEIDHRCQAGPGEEIRLGDKYDGGNKGPSDPPTGGILVPSDSEIGGKHPDGSGGAIEPLYRVWYGTNRKPVDEHNKGFSDSRDHVLHYGSAYVYIPKSHQFGSVGSSWIMRTVTLTDDQLKIRRIEPLDRVKFISELRSSLKKRDSGHRKALIYIHGYNVSFDEAVTRAAQIGFDLKVEGVTALYSWPSKGSLSGYAADEATVESSEDFLKEFLMKIVLESDAEQVDVIAHSMGNRAFLRAIESMAPAMKSAGKKFGQIFLAAPDVGVDLFERLASIYPSISTRTTLYVSSKDFALNASAFHHQDNRAGFYPPITTLTGIDTVQVSNVDLTLLGHGYFASAEAVLHDMFDLMRSNLSPLQRIRLHPRPTDTKPVYWEMGQ